MGIIQVHYNDFRIKWSKSNLNQYVVIKMVYIGKYFQLSFGSMKLFILKILIMCRVTVIGV